MLHTIDNGQIRLTASCKGAELQSVIFRDKEYLWQADPAYWGQRSPVLFPFVGRLPDKTYCLDQKSYCLELHGFAGKSDFVPETEEANALTFLLQDSEQTMQVFPRRFALKIRYELADNRIHITYTVINRDEKTMYFGLGGHPGFRVPLEEQETFEDYRLRFPNANGQHRVLVAPDCLMSGETAPFPLDEEQSLSLTHHLFDDEAIILQNYGGTVILESEKHSITMTLPDMPYVSFWQPQFTDAPFLCMEPWVTLPATHGMPAVFEQMPGLVRLLPGQCYENRWSVSLT